MELRAFTAPLTWIPSLRSLYANDEDLRNKFFDIPGGINVVSRLGSPSSEAEVYYVKFINPETNAETSAALKLCRENRSRILRRMKKRYEMR